MTRRYIITVALSGGILGLPSSGKAQDQGQTLRSKKEIADMWRKAAATYPAEVARAKKAGILLPVKPQRTPMPPVAENAALVYLALMKKQQELPEKDMRVLDRFFNNPDPTPEWLEKARQSLARCSSALGLVHQAARCPKCVFPPDWNSRNPSDSRAYEIGAISDAVQLLTVESLLLAHGGEGRKAAHNLALGFRLARHAAMEGSHLNWANAVDCTKTTANGMRRILFVRSGDAETAHAVRESIEKEWRPLSLAPIMRDEANNEQAELASYRKQGFLAMLVAEALQTPADPASVPREEEMFDATTRTVIRDNDKFLFDARAAYMLRHRIKLVEAADRPYPEARPVFFGFHDEGSAPVPLSAVWRTFASTPEVWDFVDEKAGLTASVQTIRAGAAVLEYQAAHNGSLPDTLAAALSPVPSDPFDGKPLRYRKENGPSGAGFVVYSVGITGEFDDESRETRFSHRLLITFFRFSPQTKK